MAEKTTWLKCCLLKCFETFQSIFFPMLDTHTLNLKEFHEVGANITTIRIMDPTDYQINNLIRDWMDSKRKEKENYRIEPNEVQVSILGSKIIK